jgi:hypothetical protein
MSSDRLMLHRNIRGVSVILPKEPLVGRISRLVGAATDACCTNTTICTQA